MMRQVLFRLDDIGIHGRHQELCLRSMLEQGFRISLGIVPGWLDASTVTLVSELARSNPGSVEVHQHGCDHTNYAGGDKSPYEFGPARPQSLQFSDIKRGAEALRRVFPNLIAPVFSPPFGEYDSSTVEVLRLLNFAMISALQHDDSIELGQASRVLDLFEWHPRIEKSVETLEREWRECRLPFVVVVLHPHFMDIDRLHTRLSLLRRWMEESECVLFGEMC